MSAVLAKMLMMAAAVGAVLPMPREREPRRVGEPTSADLDAIEAADAKRERKRKKRLRDLQAPGAAPKEEP